MLNRIWNEMLEKILFLGLLFGLLYFLLIVSDSGATLFRSATYYFWVVAPLVFFSLILALLETLFKKKNDEIM